MVTGPVTYSRHGPRLTSAFVSPSPLSRQLRSSVRNVTNPRGPRRAAVPSETAARPLHLVCSAAAAETDSGAEAALDGAVDADSNAGVPRRWRIALAAGTVHALHVAAIYLGPSTLMSPIRAELGLTITQVALPLNVFRLVNCVLLIPVGAAMDRIGVSRVLWPSMLLAGFFALLAPFAQSLVHLTLLQAVFAITKLFGGLTAMLMIISAAFGEGQAGTPSSVILSGYSFAGFLAPALIGILSDRFGWRAALGVLSTLFVTIALPLSHRYLRTPVRPTMPAQHSLNATESALQVPASAEPLFPRKYAAALAMMSALAVSIHVVLDHLLLYMREDVGFSFRTCTVYMSLLNLVALLAKLVAGWLSDRFDRGLLFAIFAALSAFSCFLLVGVSPTGALVLTKTHARILSFVITYGFGYSAVFTLITTSLPEFGRRRMGMRSNLNLMALFGFGSIGSYAAGFLRTTTGSYAQSFLLNSLSWVAIFICIAIYSKGSRISNSRKQSGRGPTPAGTLVDNEL